VEHCGRLVGEIEMTLNDMLSLISNAIAIAIIGYLTWLLSAPVILRAIKAASKREERFFAWLILFLYIFVSELVLFAGVAFSGISGSSDVVSAYALLSFITAISIHAKSERWLVRMKGGLIRQINWALILILSVIVSFFVYFILELLLGDCLYTGITWAVSTAAKLFGG
jgi:hypothetical protein